MINIPLQAVPNQTLAVTLNRQSAQIAVRQNGKNIYFGLRSNTTPIIRTKVCRDRNRLLLDVGYRGFIGDFAFVDTQGTDDPLYTGLGSRFLLFYIGVDE